MFPPGFMYDHYSTDSYITSITTNGTVENATVSLPFPAGEDVAPDFDSTLWIHDDEGNRLTDWNARIADTAHGRCSGWGPAAWWARSLRPLDARAAWLAGRPADDRPRPDPREHDESQVDTGSHLVLHFVAGASGSRHRDAIPIGNASFLAPPTDMRAADRRHGWADEEVACSNFTTMTRATYEAEGSAVLTVGEIRFTGTNEWGFRLSNSYNTFETTISPQSSTDGRQGWTAVDGHLHAGEGRYDGPKR
jgi:hypothetical protein